MRRKDMTHENSAAKSVQKPTQVRIAILLLYVYTVISILVYSALSIINGKFSIGSFIYQAIISLVSIFFIFMISKGKTWPRNLLLIFLILGTCSMLYLLPSIKVNLRYQFIISGIKYPLGLIPIILLYFKPAKQWFETFK